MYVFIIGQVLISADANFQVVSSRPGKLYAEKQVIISTIRAVSSDIGPQWAGIKYRCPVPLGLTRVTRIGWGAEIINANKCWLSLTTSSVWASINAIIVFILSKTDGVRPDVFSWWLSMCYANAINIIGVNVAMFSGVESIWWPKLVSSHYPTHFLVGLP